MPGLKNLLQIEEIRLQKIADLVKKQLLNTPEGSLRITTSKNNDHPRFYQRIDGVTTNNGKYISKGDYELAQQLAQKRYNEKVLKLTERRLSQIRRILKDYQENEMEQIYLSESPTRQSLICPIEPTWDQFVEKWMKEEFTAKEFRESDPEIYTIRGERVRSKSEREIADYFYQHGIPYQYEKPIFLKGFGWVYPDFTFLSRKFRKIMYWEHLGKMDDSQYAQKAVQKINTYEKNGIYPGESLILTYETSKTVVNTRDIERLVNKYIL